MKTGLLIMSLILASGLSAMAAETAPAGRTSKTQSIPEKLWSLELQGELSPWLARRSGGAVGIRYQPMRMLSSDLRLRYVDGEYRALFARLSPSQAALNTSSEYVKRELSSDRLSGFMIEPGLRVRGSVFRTPGSRWSQTARAGLIYGKLRDHLYAENVQVAALSAEFSMPYQLTRQGGSFLVPLLGYEYGFAHRVPAQEGEMRQHRKLYYLSYRAGIGIEWVF